MKTDEHIALLQKYDSRLTEVEMAQAAITAGTNQILHSLGDDWVDSYLTAIIPKVCERAIEKNVRAMQWLSTLQAVIVMLNGIHLVPQDGAKFAEAMDIII